MPAPILDFASLSFHVPIKASSAARKRLAATAEMRSASRVVLVFMAHSAFGLTNPSRPIDAEIGFLADHCDKMTVTLVPLWMIARWNVRNPAARQRQITMHCPKRSDSNPETDDRTHSRPD